ncbi:MAG TPA: TIGR02996 domain-containing protein [Gemmataceae bacterium]|nr:TIGR02996 domain-containing protein [Gemmataceae bacterium]
METEENALIAAVVANPADDAPRLIYADWLQERGQDAKAEYMRLVNEFQHPPERPESVDRCLAVAAALDEDWRRKVGARFEVVLDGVAGVMLVAYALSSVLKLALPQSARHWKKDKLFRLRCGLTREEAEQTVRSLWVNLFRKADAGEPVIRVFVRPMEGDSTLGLLAPAH